MQFSDSDFKGLMLPVHNVAEGVNLLTRFPILSLYDEFNVDLGKLDKNKVIRYIVYVFDRSSPLVGNIKDVLSRRATGLSLAGFALSHRGYDDIVEQMAMGSNGLVNRMIIRYCILQGPADYAALVSYEETLRRQAAQLMDEGHETKELKDLSTNIDFLRGKIRDIHVLLLSDGNDWTLGRSLFEVVESENLGISPEDYAKLLGESRGIKLRNAKDSQG